MILCQQHKMRCNVSTGLSNLKIAQPGGEQAAVRRPSEPARRRSHPGSPTFTQNTGNQARLSTIWSNTYPLQNVCGCMFGVSDTGAGV